MKLRISLSDIVVSPSFLEGNHLFNQKKVRVAGVSPSGDGIVVDGVSELRGKRQVSIKIDRTGSIESSICSLHGEALCEDVVALSLKYNELEVEEEKPLSQLSEIIRKPLTAQKVEIVNISVESEKKIVLEGKGTFIETIRKSMTQENYPVFLFMNPELFSIGKNVLKRTEAPLEIHYSIEENILRFKLPPGVFYFSSSRVFLNSETFEVGMISPEADKIITSLLSFSVTIEKEEEVPPYIDRLSDLSRDVFSFSGALSFKSSQIDSADLLFCLDFKNRWIDMELHILSEGHRFPFKPRRKAAEQVYSLDGRIFYLTSDFVRRIRSVVKDTGFRLSGNRYRADVSLLPKLIGEEGELEKIGKVEMRREVERVTYSEDQIKETDISIKVNMDDGWFSFDLNLPETARPIPAESLLDAVKQSEQGIEKPVVLDNDGNPVIIEKSAAFIDRIRELLLDGSIVPDEKIAGYYLPHILKGKGKRQIVEFEGSFPVEEFQGIVDTLGEGKLPEIELPENVSSLLRPYQTEGVRWLSLLRRLRLGGILADEMGLGKTIQSLSCLIHIASREENSLPSIVIAPKTLVWSWEREIEKFFPEMERDVIGSVTPEERSRLWRKEGRRLIITSYHIVLNDHHFIKDRQFDTVIVDEAQHLKNPSTKRFRAISSLKSNFRVALTGTPVENRIRDLWSIFHFLMPGLLGKRTEIERVERTSDVKGLEHTLNVVSPFILRRTKKEILKELPPLIVKEYPVEMSPRQKEIYLSLLLRGRAGFLESRGEMDHIQILTLLTKLRLAANHPDLVSQEGEDVLESGKIQILLELIDEIQEAGGRVLIFSQFVKMLKIVEKVLLEKEIPFLYMDGSTKNRGELVDRFNDGEGTAFLLSLKVGGVGLNLTGADNVIILDPWWNPAVEEQAFSRAHRIGQNREVVVSKLFSRETIEEKILNIQRDKKDLSDFFISGAMTEPSKDFVRRIAEMELKV